MLFGVDAHPDFQAGLNIEQLAREGHAFLVVKATQGAVGYTSGPTFDDWIRRARAAGMVAGAYHWLDSSDPVRQADRFLARLASVGGPDGLLLQIDCEDTQSPATASHLTQFVGRMNIRTGGHPLLLYSGSWWYGPHLGGFAAAALGLRLWHSSYVYGSGAAANLAALIGQTMWAPGYGGFGEATVLQFSSRGTAGGIVGNVDVNAFKGTRADLLALTTSRGDELMANASEVIMAWSGGFPKTSDGAPVAPVQWQIAAEAFQRSVLSTLAASAAREQATMAAIDALAKVVQAGGGDVDVAAIKAEILDAENRVKADVGAHFDRLAAAQQAAADALNG